VDAQLALLGACQPSGGAPPWAGSRGILANDSPHAAGSIHTVFPLAE